MMMMVLPLQVRPSGSVGSEINGVMARGIKVNGTKAGHTWSMELEW